MSHVPLLGRLAVVGALISVLMVAGCGGGADVAIVVAAPPPVTALDIVLTRTGPQTVQVDWSDDPYVASFVVGRDGSALVTNVTSTTVVDNSVVFDQSYCYWVDGYDGAGNLIAASDTACITIVP